MMAHLLAACNSFHSLGICSGWCTQRDGRVPQCRHSWLSVGGTAQSMLWIGPFLALVGVVAGEMMATSRHDGTHGAQFSVVLRHLDAALLRGLVPGQVLLSAHTHRRTTYVDEGQLERNVHFKLFIGTEHLAIMSSMTPVRSPVRSPFRCHSPAVYPHPSKAFPR